MLFFVLFAAMVPLANWMIGNVGTECVPNGPCLIPVAPGLLAPSGVLVIGAALVLRDFVQRQLGLGWALAAIVLGAFISIFVARPGFFDDPLRYLAPDEFIGALLAPPLIVVASTVAFLLSELADLLVYTPLQARRLTLAVLLSGVVGAVVDSAAFLYLAFESLQYFEGQFVGKMWAAIIAAPLIWLARRGAGGTMRAHS